ncbi:Dabb family protein [uncultured Draconibacterium sp.]|uniref:Dabb family protein n=1 Tax=uncultured Draconibacterium sp. TaxID=1573823 RepID=UPI0032168713
MKTRRNFIKKAASALAVAGLLPLAKKSMAGEVKITGTLVHHVYFWLKEPKNEAHKNQLVKGANELLKIKSIKMSHIGFPAGTENRDVVDHSYSVSYMVMFDSQADQDAYQVDPIHLKFVEENQHLWNKVIVYDSVN